MKKVFINRRQVSNEAAEALLKLYPAGGIFSEESVYRMLRKITKEMLPEGCAKTPTQIRSELDKFISEELTIKIDVEGVTCEKCERKVTVEDEHQKAMTKLAEMAEKEHQEVVAKKDEETVAEEPEAVVEPSEAIVEDEESTPEVVVEEVVEEPKEEVKEVPVAKKPAATKTSRTSKKKMSKKKK